MIAELRSRLYCVRIVGRFDKGGSVNFDAHFHLHHRACGGEKGDIGGITAMLTFGFSESIAGWFSGTPVGDQFAALLGTFALPASGYLALAAQAVMIAAVTAWASRRTLFATLQEMD